MVSKIAISEGYSYFDLRKDRLEKIKLSKKQLEEIDSIFQKELVSLSSVVFTPSKGINANEIKNLMRICNKYSIFFMDAVHFLLADKEKCDFFVTSDKDLLGKLRKLTKVQFLSEKVRAISPQEFKHSVLKDISF